MHRIHGREKENIQVIAVGFVLILVVSGLFFVKSFFFSKDSSGNSKPQENISSGIDLSKIGKVNPDDLRNKLINDRSMIVIDIRNADEYQAEHIIDSKNIPLDSLPSFMSSMDSSKSYIIVDASGDIGALKTVAALASKINAKNISYLDGGFSLWKSNMNPTISDGNPSSFSDQAKVSYVKVDELKAAMDKGANMIIIDVRTSQEYKTEHLKGAINIFVDDLEAKRRQLPLGKRIVVYDNDSLIAFKAAARLYDLGVFNVFSLAEGLNVWKQKGYETVKQ